MKKLFYILPAVALVMMSGCKDDEPGAGGKIKDFKPIELDGGEITVAEHTSDFAFRLIGSMHKLQPSNNVLLSPLSATMALSLAANGAEGDVQTELLDVLGFNDLNMSDVNSFNKKIAESIPLSDPSTALS